MHQTAHINSSSLQQCSPWSQGQAHSTYCIAEDYFQEGNNKTEDSTQNLETTEINRVRTSDTNKNIKCEISVRMYQDTYLCAKGVAQLKPRPRRERNNTPHPRENRQDETNKSKSKKGRKFFCLSTTVNTKKKA